MAEVQELKDEVTILFAGDSGDGIQLTGTQFTNTAALLGNDISTFPNFPAEIRAPQGTLAGVSGFQLHFGSVEIFTPGDQADVLVVMNAAALKANLGKLKEGGTIVANTGGFDKKNLRLAKIESESSPLEDGSLERYKLFSMDVTKMTRDALSESGMGIKEIDRCKNMFVLGFVYWMYNRNLDQTVDFINSKFKSNQQVAESNIKVLKAGYHFGDTTETFSTQYEVKPAPMKPGVYRNIMGNQAAALGLIAASQKSGLQLFFGTYPITPASDILHELSRYKNFGVKTYQAEDEIAAACSAIGAAYGGALGITASSGPGIALKGEAIGLAVILELPMVICSIQRGGPSTGLPTKTEQADLFQTLYGRNGEAPLPVVSASSPSDCFDAAFEACRIAVEHMTPVFFLSDGYMATGSEPWEFPKASDLPEIHPKIAKQKDSDTAYLPYERDDLLVREWALPGTKGLEHRVGGLEKEDLTGNVSYDPENHEHMVKTRQGKIDNIAKVIPEQEIAYGPDRGKLLVIGWGGTYGAIATAVKHLLDDGHEVAHAHIRYLSPFPNNLGELMKRYDKVLVPEINNGQLVRVLRGQFLVDAVPYNKIMGMPFTVEEIQTKALELLS